MVATHLVEFFFDLKSFFEAFLSTLIVAPLILFRVVECGILVSSLEATLQWLPPLPVPLTPKQRLRILLKSMQLVRTGRVNVKCHWSLFNLILDHLETLESQSSRSETLRTLLWALSQLDVPRPSTKSTYNHHLLSDQSLLCNLRDFAFSLSSDQASTLRHFGSGFSSDITGDGPPKARSARKAASNPSTPQGSFDSRSFDSGGTPLLHTSSTGSAGSVSLGPTAVPPVISASTTGPVLDTSSSLVSSSSGLVPSTSVMQSQLDLLSQSVLALTQLVSSAHQHRVPYAISRNRNLVTLQFCDRTQL